jgi:hypothetical protein
MDVHWMGITLANTRDNWGNIHVRKVDRILFRIKFKMLFQNKIRIIVYLTDNSKGIGHFAHVVDRELDNAAQPEVEMDKTLARLLLNKYKKPIIVAILQ